MTLQSGKSAALLAIALDDKKPTGIKPTLLDIDLWRRGKLNKKRSAEVKSFVAHDSDCYQLWMDLLESEAFFETEEKPEKVSLFLTMRNWFSSINYSWVGGSLALATVAMVAVSLNTMMQPNLIADIDSDYTHFSGNPMATHWYYQFNDKSINFNPPTTYDRLKPAALYGIREGLLQLQQNGQLATEPSWNEVIASYPIELPLCPEKMVADDCQQQQQLLLTFGRSLALMQLRCADTNDRPAENFYAEQQQRVVTFKNKVSAHKSLSPLTKELQSWQHTVNKMAFCDQVKQLLNHIEE